MNSRPADEDHIYKLSESKKRLIVERLVTSHTRRSPISFSSFTAATNLSAVCKKIECNPEDVTALAQVWGPSPEDFSDAYFKYTKSYDFTVS